MSLVHISGWVQVTDPSRPSGPTDPGWGVTPPTDPGYGRPGWAPPDPGYDRPAWGGRPDQGLPPEGGHVWGALVRWLLRPQGGGGPAKPPGLRPIQPLPPSPGHPGNRPPNGGKPPHPWIPGHWEPIDPGFGKPPLWGFLPDIDNGLPEAPSTKPIDPDVPGTKPTPPGQGGAWFPTDPDFGKPVRPCPPVGGKPHPPIWAWVPDRPEVDPIPPEGGGGTGEGVNVYPTEQTVLAAGGTVQLSVSVYPGGTTLDWTVGGLPDWVTAAPASGNTSAVVVLTAAVNTTGLPKQAFITVADKTFTLNQGSV